MPIITDGESGLLARGNINRGGALAYFPSPGAAVDCTDALQDDLDVIAANGGGVVYLGAGEYKLDGQLSIGRGVTLEGIQRLASFTHINYDRYVGLGGTGSGYEYGTVLKTTANAANESGDPFITLNTQSALRCLSIYYPNQSEDSVTPVAYPWAIKMVGNVGSMVDRVELVNPYKGIYAYQAYRHIIRDVIGQPIYKGLEVDLCLDVARHENIHWIPAWTFWVDGSEVSGIDTPMEAWIAANGIGFTYKRSDYQNARSLFAFRYKTGILFDSTDSSGSYGDFQQIGMDSCDICVDVVDSRFAEIRMSGCEFFGYSNILKVRSTNTGKIHISNANFRSATVQVSTAGTGQVTVSDSTFSQFVDTNSIELGGSHDVIQNCRFDTTGTNHISIGSGSLAPRVLGCSSINGPLTLVNASITGGYDGITGNAAGRRNITATTYTLASTDHEKELWFNNSADITVTAPATIPKNFRCTIIQKGAGTVTISPATGATLYNAGGFNRTSGVRAVAQLRIENNGGNNARYYLSGDCAGTGATTSDTFIVPDAVTGTTLELWLKDDTLGADGASVDTWTDSSAASHNLTQATSANRPVVAANVLNGYKVVRFDGTNDRLSGTPTNSASRTLFVLVKKRSAASSDAGHAAFTVGNGDQFYAYSPSSATAWNRYAGYAGDGVVTGSVVTDWTVLEIVWAGGNIDIYANGSLARSGASGTIYSDTADLILGSTSSGSWCDVDIAEVVEYSGDIGGTNRAGVRNYLIDKFGL